ncbi:MAG: nickel pincer cofactor biosynthesis protein LarC [Nitrosopumilus sp.]|nr:nickel pincer cofactor biosynthesis protein LarC [Nitrosopumilus sp.]
MNKIIIIDPQITGISGDMLLSSLVDSGANKNKIIKNIYKIQNYFQDAKINKIDFIKTETNGIKATKFIFDFDEKLKEKNAVDMYRIIADCCHNIELSEKAKKFTIESIKTIIKVESIIHNKEIKDLHLHESSSIDTGADLIGCATALDDLDLLNNSIFYTTKVAVGGGVTKFSHGIIPNPTNSILEIFRISKIPIKGGPIDTELTTPTGASMLVNLDPENIKDYPEFIPEKIGYGTGTKEFKGIPNILRISIGKPPDIFSNILTDTVTVLETNIDDISGEIIGNLVDKISTKDGAVKDVTVINGITKKNRPTYILRIVCSNEIEKKIAEVIFQETGTLGIRKSRTERYILGRFNLLIPIEIEKESFVVNVKISKNSNGELINIKPEFDDIKKIADKINYPLKRTIEIVNNLIFQRNIYDI